MRQLANKIEVDLDWFGPDEATEEEPVLLQLDIDFTKLAETIGDEQAEMEAFKIAEKIKNSLISSEEFRHPIQSRMKRYDFEPPISLGTTSIRGLSELSQHGVYIADTMDEYKSIMVYALTPMECDYQLMGTKVNKILDEIDEEIKRSMPQDQRGERHRG